MDSNKSQKLEAFKHFILKPPFLVGFVLGIILGIFISYVCGLSVSPAFNFVAGIVIAVVGNYVYGKLKKRLRGDKLYCNTSITVNNIYLEAQLPNTATIQTALSKIIKVTASSNN